MASLNLDAEVDIQQLEEMKNSDGLSVIETIAAGKYEKFGMFLLNDKNEKKVDIHKRNNQMSGAEAVTKAILKDWLVESDQPRTWRHLITCIRKAGMRAFSDYLEKKMTDTGSSEAVPTTDTAAATGVPSSATKQPHPVAVDSDDINKPPIDKVIGFGRPYCLNTTVFDAPDPVSYWRLNNCEYKGEGTTLLMFDSGIHNAHPSFDSKKAKGSLLFYNDNAKTNDTDGHGTFCAGIACGDPIEVSYPDRKVTCSGVAPNAKLAIWKTDFDDMWLTEFERMSSIAGTDAAPPVDVVVISSGFNTHIAQLENAIGQLDRKGVIVVCAASNQGAQDRTNIYYPALYSQTICVGANNRYGRQCEFSPEGKEVDVLALGNDVLGPNLENFVTQGDGTSFAAPAIGGLICLILEAVTKVCGQETRKQLKTNRAIRLLLKELTTDNGAISPKELEKFFQDPGPKNYIDRLKRDL